MNEFIVTMKRWKVMCDCFEKKNENNPNACDGCPLEGNDMCGAIFEINTASNNLTELIEIINEWYQNNTSNWYEYLNSIIPGFDSLSDSAAIQTLLDTQISPDLYVKLKS